MLAFGNDPAYRLIFATSAEDNAEKGESSCSKSQSCLVWLVWLQCLCR